MYRQNLLSSLKAAAIPPWGHRLHRIRDHPVCRVRTLNELKVRPGQGTVVVIPRVDVVRHPTHGRIRRLAVAPELRKPGPTAEGDPTGRALLQCVSTSKKNYWTIHGLWPSGDNTSPSFCIDEQFNGRVLDWQKHGTCAGDVPALNGLFKFFNSTLAVYKKYNIFEFLSNSLIRPSVVRTYSAAEIRNALSDDIREKVNIVCNQRVPNRDAPVLTEIRFCLDKNLETVNCQGKNGGCGRRNYYLPARP
ncbi:hypothetical protein HPB50_009716 [Hyalomma asiaticum]|uniref:Uncharacterized protein n=1 Tax=Hyalomma asiaticum TaxID=266040 RepID=A0ACB7RST3_HYAAI|nr:hypothetical protein HPB50_009716 [Hyalomma asiaticum]